MRVFVAGATGVIGRQLVPALAREGHHVVGMTRSDAKVASLRALGAEPVICDVYDAERLRQVVEDARPDATTHQLTDLPSHMNARRLTPDYAANDRVRRAGTRNLVVAGRAAGARRVIAQSVAFFYAPTGDVDGELKREEDPLWLD